MNVIPERFEIGSKGIKSSIELAHEELNNRSIQSAPRLNRTNERSSLIYNGQALSLVYFSLPESHE